MAQKIPKHPSGIRQEIVDKVMNRRGRLHAYSKINPTETALTLTRPLDVTAMSK